MQTRVNKTQRPRRRAFALLALLTGTGAALAACGTAQSLNPWKEKEVPLPGERVSVLRPQDLPTADPAVASKPVALPAPQNNEAWPQPGGTAGNSPGHLAFSGSLRTVWSADAGEGSSDSGRLISSPIVYQGRVYTLDSEANVTAFSTGGSRVWRVSLAPPNERGREGYGGGLAADDGRLYVTTGFGTAVALNPANGEVLWTNKVGEPIRTSPTAGGGKVFFVTTESELYWLNGADGTVDFKHRGTPEPATLLSNVSPAVTGDVVVVPFPSGEVVAYQISAKRPIWVESVAGTRSGSALAALRDPARPVIDGGVVYAAGHSGRIIATGLENGQRVWTENIGSTQTPVVAGDTVFVLDAARRVVALTRRDGKIRWTADLPEANKWNGPVLAGGKLWLISSKGLLISLDAQNGATGSRRDFDTDVLIAPIVAGGRMYILTDRAGLIALD